MYNKHVKIHGWRDLGKMEMCLGVIQTLVRLLTEWFNDFDERSGCNVY